LAGAEQVGGNRAERRPAVRLATADRGGDAPSGWWLVPVVIGGLLAWAWIVRLAVGFIAKLF